MWKVVRVFFIESPVIDFSMLRGQYVKGEGVNKNTESNRAGGQGMTEAMTKTKSPQSLSNRPLRNYWYCSGEGQPGPCNW